MEAVFSKILNMSLTASVVILLVLPVRLALKKAPKIYSYALWAVVLFRLLCPVSFSAPVSVLEVTAPKVQAGETVSAVYYDVVERAVAEPEPDLPQEPAPSEEPEQKPPLPSVSLMEAAECIWLAGLCVMVLHSALNYIRLKRRLVGAVLWRGEIYLADHMDTPFVLGLIRPRIYLPSGMSAAERRYIVAHERHHIRRLDHWWKLLGYGALCLHWFNPLVWLAFCLAGKDMEMSCDEAVIRRLGPHIRADYAQSLLRLATGKKLGMPLAFGEGDTRGRVKNMAKWKRPRVWVSVLCAVLCLTVLAVCALNPEEEESLGEMTRMAGPCSCAVGDLNFYLPEGTSHEMVETMELNDWELKKVMKEKKGIYPYQLIFTDETGTFGGIRRYYTTPENGSLQSGWIKELPLMEYDDPTLGHYGESSAICNYELEFFTDRPGGAPYEKHSKHYIFLSEDKTMAYDLWFDLLTVDREIMDTILDSAIVGGGSHRPVRTSGHTYRELDIVLPEGYLFVLNDTSTAKIAAGSTFVGGITAYDVPDIELKFGSPYPMEEWNTDEWLTAMGFEEEKGLAYMGGGSVYGDFEGRYTSDVPEGQPITADRYHTFFIREDYVYDVWFDMTKVAVNVRDAILSSVSGEQEATEPPLPAEEMFTERFISNDGTVNISVEANIPSDVGNVGLGMLDAVPHYITEAEAEHIAHTIFGEDAVFTKVAPVFEKHNVTEEQLRSAIDRSSLYTTAEDWVPLVGTAGAHGNTCEELAEQTVKLMEYWESQLQNFRCNYPEEVCDFTYQNAAYYFDAPGNASDSAIAESGDSIEAWVEMDGYSYKYTVSTRNKDDFKLNNIYVTMEWPVSNSELDSRVPRWIHCTTKPTQEHIDAVKEKASAILNDMDLGDWIVDDVYVETHTYNNPDAPEYIIRVNAVPLVNGIPAIRWGQHGTINTRSDNAVVDNYYLPMADFSYAADGTLLGMTLYSPMEETAISRTNTGLGNEALLAIAMDELKKINIDDCGLNVTEMGYDPVPRCDVEVSNIRVGYARVRVADTEATYRYIPALALYGRKTYTFANGDKLEWMDRAENILTLNALDGSMITDMKHRITVTP